MVVFNGMMGGPPNVVYDWRMSGIVRFDMDEISCLIWGWVGQQVLYSVGGWVGELETISMRSRVWWEDGWEPNVMFSLLPWTHHLLACRFLHAMFWKKYLPQRQQYLHGISIHSITVQLCQSSFDECFNWELFYYLNNFPNWQCEALSPPLPTYNTSVVYFLRESTLTIR